MYKVNLKFFRHLAQHLWRVSWPTILYASQHNKNGRNERLIIRHNFVQTYEKNEKRLFFMNSTLVLH